MSEEIKDQVAEAEVTTETSECACECGCEAAAAAPCAAKKSNNIVRIVVWAVVVALALVVFIFRGDIIEYSQRSKNIAMINEMAVEELGYKPFKVDALGNYKFQVICQEKPADNLKQFNVVDFEVKDGIVQEASDKDKNNWINMKKMGVKAPAKAEEKTEAKTEEKK